VWEMKKYTIGQGGDDYHTYSTKEEG
jgi:hypothetical protein